MSLTLGNKRALSTVHDVENVSKVAKTSRMAPSSPCKTGCLNADNTIRECFEQDEFEIAPILSQNILMSQTAPVSPSNEQMEDSASVEEFNLKQVLSALRGKVIEIEGNIGCGKSTLTTQLSKLFNTEENLSELHSEMVNNEFLKSFYDDPKRQGFAFQMYMLTTRLGQIAQALGESRRFGKISILDRGAVGDVLFALNNHQEGNISDSDMEIYKSVCRQRLPLTLRDDVDMVLYLNVSPEECWRRMVDVRQRDAEKNVPPTYLFCIDYVYHELLIEWLGDRKGRYFNMNVGPAPPLRVINWENFGCTKKTAKLLASLQSTHCNPVVRFMNELDAEDTQDVVLRTEKEVEEFYQAMMNAQDEIEYNGNTWSVNDKMRVAINFHIDRKTHHISRRLGFKLLQDMHTITYFGQGAMPEQQ